MLAFASSSSALLLALGLGAALGFGSTAGWVDVTLEERLGAGCSPLASTAGAFRAGICVVVEWAGRWAEKRERNRVCKISGFYWGVNSVQFTIAARKS